MRVATPSHRLSSPFQHIPEDRSYRWQILAREPMRAFSHHQVAEAIEEFVRVKRLSISATRLASI
jgi:hypothetical protein